MGKVFWPSFAPWWMEAQKELLQFPTVPETTWSMRCAISAWAWPMQQPLKRQKPAPKVVKPGTLGWVKAQSVARQIGNDRMVTAHNA